MTERNVFKCPRAIWKDLSPVGRQVYNETYKAMVQSEHISIDKDLWDGVRHQAATSAAQCLERVLGRTS